MSDITNRLVEKFGKNNQILKCVEELSELQQALCKINSADKSGVTFENVVEEIADVEIMLNQIKIILDIPESDIENMKNYKIMRTAKRYLGGEINE